jgi:hypothetical protein
MPEMLSPTQVPELRYLTIQEMLIILPYRGMQFIAPKEEEAFIWMDQQTAYS